MNGSARRVISTIPGVLFAVLVTLGVASCATYNDPGRIYDGQNRWMAILSSEIGTDIKLTLLKARLSSKYTVEVISKNERPDGVFWEAKSFFGPNGPHPRDNFDASTLIKVHLKSESNFANGAHYEWIGQLIFDSSDNLVDYWTSLYSETGELL